ncbi:EF-P lysine aminoacylase EpmA [Halioxenophilus sp. WMMB6]|uniref:EF-P lysine aminoacylase EpmA n=1 Tax=Halioxenophilus sp. WMMB6 TaxID=3073815 RepID=UPI00295F034C|nr:EF-P lysine aminoacylase EpmA [Halioxenophilus sp. WMMB6]
MTDSIPSWRPSASLAVIKARAALLAHIRHFFAERAVLEVDVPSLSRHTVTDPNLIPVTSHTNGGDAFLQTSPEYFMKRLLVAGSGSIYYLGKAFRDQEFGRRHHPEFTMLEWYRLGFDDQQLIEETLALVTGLLPAKPVTRVTYGQLFAGHFGINPHTASEAELAELAQRTCQPAFHQADRNTWLDLLFSHCLEPTLAGITVVADFPASQGALAKVMANDAGEQVAKRFEIYVDGLELSNGYWEATGAVELQARFERDQATRLAAGLPVPAIDPDFMAAMHAGLPECAGIALGVDRLLLLMSGVKTLAETMSFAPFSGQ